MTRYSLSSSPFKLSKTNIYRYVVVLHTLCAVCCAQDILEPGNRVYSPQTCLFVPQEINNLLSQPRGPRTRKSAQRNYPIGVYRVKNGKAYCAKISKYGEKVREGRTC